MKALSSLALLVLLLFGMHSNIAFAQGTGITLHLEQVDVTAYPNITIHLSA